MATTDTPTPRRLALGAYALRQETPDAFHMHGPGGPFVMAKKGLHPDTVKEVQQHFAGGGDVEEVDEDPVQHVANQLRINASAPATTKLQPVPGGVDVSTTLQSTKGSGPRPARPGSSAAPPRAMATGGAVQRYDDGGVVQPAAPATPPSASAPTSPPPDAAQPTVTEIQHPDGSVVRHTSAPGHAFDATQLYRTLASGLSNSLTPAQMQELATLRRNEPAAARNDAAPGAPGQPAEWTRNLTPEQIKAALDGSMTASGFPLPGQLKYQPPAATGPIVLNPPPKDATDSEPLAFKPRVQAQPQPPTTSAAPPMDAGAGDEAAAIKAGTEAATSRAAAEGELGRQLAKNYSAYGDELQRQAAERRQLSDEAALETNKRMAQYQTALNGLNSLDTRVDPNRYWNDKGMGSKIAAIAGVFLNGIAGGHNQALEMLEHAKDQDLAAQDKEHQLALEKGKSGVESTRSLVGMTHQIFQDRASAMLAAHAAASEQMATKLQELTAAAKDPIAQSEAQQAIAGLRHESAQYKQAAAARAQQNYFEQSKLDLENKKVSLMGGKVNATAGIEQALDQYAKRLADNPAGATLGDDRKLLMLGAQESMGERASPEVMSMIDSALPGRPAGFADKALGQRWAQDRIEKVKQIIRAAHQAKAGLAPAPVTGG